jgi:membrane-bound lytic murein transglycosylase B
VAVVLAASLYPSAVVGADGTPGLRAAEPTTTTVPTSPTSTSAPASSAPTATTVLATTTTLPVAVPTDLPPVVLGDDGASGAGALLLPPGFVVGATVPLPAGVPSQASPALASVRSSERRLTRAESTASRAARAVTEATERLAAAQQRVATSDAELAELSRADRAASARASEAHVQLGQMAAQAVVSGTGRSDLVTVLSSATPGDAQARLTLTHHLSDDLAEVAARWKAARAELSHRASGAERRRTEALSEQAGAQAALDQALAGQRTADAAVESARAAARGHAFLGIPARALDAYLRAAALVGRTDPGCQLPWWAIASIGRTESGHGTFGGAAPQADGQTLPVIVGPVLDGTNGTMRIADHDLGLLDGDPVLDRAVGPMQFIPETWLRNGVDASGDGRADPNNIYDAAFTAARYLCRAAGGLPMNTEAGFLRAALSYSHDPSYGAASWAGSEPYRAAAAAGG